MVYPSSNTPLRTQSIVLPQSLTRDTPSTGKVRARARGRTGTRTFPAGTTHLMAASKLARKISAEHVTNVMFVFQGAGPSGLPASDFQVVVTTTAEAG
ncbi:hypothetical protein JCM13591A_20020 [Microbacterium xylanilyticum]